MKIKRKYYIWDDNIKDFVSDFIGCPRSSTNKTEVESFLKEHQEYEAGLSEEDQKSWIESGLSYKYCYIMLLTEEEMFNFRKQNI